jgi:hypothetical protein
MKPFFGIFRNKVFIIKYSVVNTILFTGGRYFLIAILATVLGIIPTQAFAVTSGVKQD